MTRLRYTIKLFFSKNFYLIECRTFNHNLHIPTLPTQVRRKVPLIPYDSDSRTVYVESIPVTASREWLERVFSEYGTVAYISLPKFKDSQRIKVNIVDDRITYT